MGVSYYEFNGQQIQIGFLDRCGRYETPKYHSLLNFIQKDNIPQSPWRKALDWFFHETEIPREEKEAIDNISICEDSRIFCIETRKSRKTFKALHYIARNTGWYFYLTGVSFGRSIVSEVVDATERRHSREQVFDNLRLSENAPIHLHCISEGPNRTSHLLVLGDWSVLLDAGINEEENWAYFKKLGIERLGAIFLSHAHYDHWRGLERILETYPDCPVLCSATTLDFYAFKNSEKPWYQESDDSSFHLSQHAKHVVTNAITVTAGETINLSEGSVTFHNAGHMPGGLMLHVDASGYDFLYTGDFSNRDHFPIQGVEATAQSLPKKTDFLLMEAAMGTAEYATPGEIFSTLFRRLRLKADYGNHVLIGADPDSTAMVLYLSIFSYFRKLQLRTGFEKRPLLVLGRETQEYARIVQTRQVDLHPVVRKSIKKGLNPFSSAVARFCEKGIDVFSLLSKPNAIFIFGPPDLGHGIVQQLFKEVSSDRYNLIYLAGALRDSPAADLVEGEDGIDVDGRHIENRAEVFNRRNPDNVLNLHADLPQMISLIHWTQPRSIGLFHNSHRSMTQISDNLSRMRGVRTVSVLSERARLCRLR